MGRYVPHSDDYSKPTVFKTIVIDGPKTAITETVQRYGARNESKHVINGKTIE